MPESDAPDRGTSARLLAEGGGAGGARRARAADEQIMGVGLMSRR